MPSFSSVKLQKREGSPTGSLSSAAFPSPPSTRQSVSPVPCEKTVSSPGNLSYLGSRSLNSKLSAKQSVRKVSNEKKIDSSVAFGTSVPSVLPTRPASDRTEILRIKTSKKV